MSDIVIAMGTVVSVVAESKYDYNEEKTLFDLSNCKSTLALDNNLNEDRVYTIPANLVVGSKYEVIIRPIVPNHTRAAEQKTTRRFNDTELD